MRKKKRIRNEEDENEMKSEKMLKEALKDHNRDSCVHTMPHASIIAFFITGIGIGLFVGCTYVSLSKTIFALSSSFSLDYELEWMRIMKLIIIGIGGGMSGLIILLLIVGWLSTGAIRKRLFNGFKSQLIGQVFSSFLLLMVYAMILVWLIISLAGVIPIFIFFMLNSSCKLKNANDYSNNDLMRSRCLYLTDYGLSIPNRRPDICEEQFVNLCQRINDIGPLLIISTIGSTFVLIGLIHFLSCLIANMIRVKNLKQMQIYDRAVSDEMQTLKLLTIDRHLRQKQQQQLHHSMDEISPRSVVTTLTTTANPSKNITTSILQQQQPNNRHQQQQQYATYSPDTIPPLKTNVVDIIDNPIQQKYHRNRSMDSIDTIDPIDIASSIYNKQKNIEPTMPSLESVRSPYTDI
ncbi:hypothetical protein SNEBB_000998 [Seison nebaliae]|nr:hypothetical protein SNEBB_000998 [Seison nebaliae]